MTLKTVTYTSRARDGLDERELEQIHASAMTLNALDGVTGMLVFNGTTFLQVIEGAPDAIDDLVGRLQADPRHVDFLVRHEGVGDQSNFPDWSMALVRVSKGRFEARRDIERSLPPAVADGTRSLILKMSDLIAG